MMFYAILSILSLIVVSKSSSITTDNSDPSTYATLSEGTLVKLGKGNNPKDLPIAECVKSQEQVGLNCTISINVNGNSKDSCNYVITSDQSSIGTELIYQLPGKKILTVWQEQNGNESVRKIRIIDFDDCSNLNEIVVPHNERHLLRRLTFFQDSFNATIVDVLDTVPIETTHAYYFNVTFINFDFYGQKISSWKTSQSTSDMSFDKLQRIEEIRNVVAFTYPHPFIKNEDPFHGINEETAFYCHHVNEWYGCFLVGRSGEVAGIDKFTEENARVIDVRNLRGKNRDVIVFFALTNETNLIVKSTRYFKSKIENYKLSWPVNRNATTIIDFNEKDGTFTLAAETKELKHRIVTQTFKLPPMNEN